MRTPPSNKGERLHNKRGFLGVETSVKIIVDEAPEPPLPTLNYIEANIPCRTRYSVDFSSERERSCNNQLPIKKYLSTSPQTHVHWYNHKDDTDRTYLVKLPDGFSADDIRYEYSVDMEKSGYSDIAWTKASYDRSNIERYLDDSHRYLHISALPKKLSALYYSSRTIDIPWTIYKPTATQYTKIYWRFRVEKDGRVGAWSYLPAIWFFYKD